MNRTANALLQFGLGLSQIGNILSPAFGESQKIYLAAGIAFAQGLISLIAHIYNPDGTSAQAPWDKK